LSDFILFAKSFIFPVLVVICISVMVAGLYSICACHNARKSPRMLRSLNRPMGFAGTKRLLESDGEDDEF